jgi:chromosome segregation ATPase
MLEQLAGELHEVCEVVKRVEAEIHKVDWDIQCLKAELEKRLAQHDSLQAQLDRLHREETSLRKRQEIALRVLSKGRDPTFVLELSQEGLVELERRIVELEEAGKTQHRQQELNWIWQLLRNPAQQKTHELPLVYDDLPKDPLRVRKVRKAILEKECNELTIQIERINKQIQVVMRYENSEDQIARLNDSKAQIEEELRQKQEELAQLTRQISTPS